MPRHNKLKNCNISKHETFISGSQLQADTQNNLNEDLRTYIKLESQMFYENNEDCPSLSSNGYMMEYETVNNNYEIEEGSEEGLENGQQHFQVQPTFLEDDDGGMRIIRTRTKEETEAAYDLLELAHSSPPLSAAQSVTSSSICGDNGWQLFQQQHQFIAEDELHQYYPIPENQKTHESYNIKQEQFDFMTENPKSQLEYFQDNLKLVNPNVELTSEYSSDTEQQYPVIQGHPKIAKIKYQEPTSEYSSDAENNSLLTSDGIKGSMRSYGSGAIVLKAISYGSYDGLVDRRRKLKLTAPVPTPGGGAAQKKYPCEQCGKEYATSSNLSRHRQIHNQPGKRCSICNKFYRSKPAMTMHLMTHKLKYKCDICYKRFSRLWLLRGHFRSHTGEKPYRCPDCGKRFSDRSNVRAHMLTHSNVKCFQCHKCDKTFTVKSYLQRHLECCDKGFDEYSSVTT